MTDALKAAREAHMPTVDELALIMFNAVNSGQVTDTFDRLSRQVQGRFYRAAKAVHRRQADALEAALAEIERLREARDIDVDSAYRNGLNAAARIISQYEMSDKTVDGIKHVSAISARLSEHIIEARKERKAHALAALCAPVLPDAVQQVVERLRASAEWHAESDGHDEHYRNFTEAAALLIRLSTVTEEDDERDEDNCLRDTSGRFIRVVYENGRGVITVASTDVRIEMIPDAFLELQGEVNEVMSMMWRDYYDD